jgi:hypothetical protein
MRAVTGVLVDRITHFWSGRSGVATASSRANHRAARSRFQSYMPLVLVVSLAAPPARAQVLPEGPLRSPDPTLRLGGEIVGTLGPPDDSAFFNYTDYEHNALRMIRLALAGQWRPIAPIAFVAEVRSEDLQHVAAHAAYVRIRPWQSRAFDIQAGRIPPSFGAYGRRTYNADNPLIGYPLAYQYLTSLRADAIPASTDDLLVMRGRGWLPSFPIGSSAESPGLPLVSAFRWDTGVQARWSGTRFEAVGSVTAGTLSDPRIGDNNGGRELSARIVAKPIVGLVVGASAARGAWLSDEITGRLPESARQRSYTQTAFGADAEYSRDYWLVRGELVWSEWTMPFVASGREQPLDALGMWVEARYRFTPRLFVAGRVDRLGFSRITGSLFGGRPTPWDAGVERVEYGAGWYFQRNLVARAVVQHNWRDGGRVTSRTFVSGQLAYWF